MFRTERFARLASRFGAVLLVAVVVAATLSLERQPDRFAPGTEVRYARDDDGRRWTVVRRVESDLYEIRSGGIFCVTDVRQIEPASARPVGGWAESTAGPAKRIGS